MSVRQNKQETQINYYDVLGVTSVSSDNDVKMAYRQLVSYWHPDKQAHDNKIAEQNLKIINEAYSNLKTYAKRSKYNQILKLQNLIDRNSISHSPKTPWGKFWKWLIMLESNQK